MGFKQSWFHFVQSWFYKTSNKILHLIRKTPPNTFAYLVAKFWYWFCKTNNVKYYLMNHWKKMIFRNIQTLCVDVWIIEKFKLSFFIYREGHHTVWNEDDLDSGIKIQSFKLHFIKPFKLLQFLSHLKIIKDTKK